MANEERILFIKRPPVGKQSPRLGWRGAYNPQSDEVKSVRRLMVNQWDEKPYKKALHLEFSFEFEPPESWSKKKRAECANKRVEKVSKPDTSNLIKFYEDCMKSIVFEDDNQVTRITASKHYGPSDIVIIYVRTVENAE